MDLHKALEQIRYDNRLLEKNKQNGVLTPEEVNKYLQSLPDLATNSQSLTLEEEYEGNGNGGFHQ